MIFKKIFWMLCTIGILLGPTTTEASQSDFWTPRDFDDPDTCCGILGIVSHRVAGTVYEIFKTSWKSKTPECEKEPGEESSHLQKEKKEN